jgi:signal transduction histidine kinase
MNAILGFSQLLIMDQENPLESLQKSNVQHILKAGQHLLALINDVLDLSKIESGHISISIEEIHLNVVISEVRELTQPLLDEKAGFQVRASRKSWNDCPCRPGSAQTSVAEPNVQRH